MSAQNGRRRTEMEVNPVLQKAIVVNHIIQVVVIILFGVVSIFLGMWLALYVISAVLPLIFFLLLWISSKCNCQDLRHILVHFNPILSTLWFVCMLPVFVLSWNIDGILPYSGVFEWQTKAVTIITGYLSLSSAIFAACGIWKSARNVVLSARYGESKPFDEQGRFRSQYEALVMFTDFDGIQLPKATYGQPV